MINFESKLTKYNKVIKVNIGFIFSKSYFLYKYFYTFRIKTKNRLHVQETYKKYGPANNLITV